MLINFCDSAFAIGESCKDKGVRYLKQIKVRNTECVYDTENVAICEIRKDSNFLRFHLQRTEREKEHLRELSSEEVSKLDGEILDLKAKKPDMSNYEIAKQLNTYEMKVGRVLKKEASKTE